MECKRMQNIQNHSSEQNTLETDLYMYIGLIIIMFFILGIS